MKKTLSLCLLVPALLLSLAIDAAMYKGLDAEGNVVYSDTPFANAEMIKLPTLTVVAPLKIKPKETAVVKEVAPDAETTYTKFTILSPKNNDTIWNNPNPTITLQLTPALKTNQGHNIWLLIDGTPLVENSQSLSIPIGHIDRGSHIIQAQIKNEAGEILKTSNSVTVSIKYSVVQRKAR